MKKFAERFQEALDVRGMKQADIVSLTKIGKSSISTYLSGEYEPKQRNIYKIATALNVDESWLMGYDVPMERKQVAPLPHAEFREVISEGGIRLLLDADAKMPQEHLDEIVEFIKFKQEKYGR